MSLTHKCKRDAVHCFGVSGARTPVLAVRRQQAGARQAVPPPPSHEAEASLPPPASAGAEANTRPGRPSCSSPRSTSGFPTRVSGALGLPTLQAQERRPGSAAAVGGATRGDAPGPARHQDHRAT